MGISTKPYRQYYIDGYSIVTMDIDGSGRCGHFIWDQEAQELIDDGLGYPTWYESRLKAQIRIEELVDEKIDIILLVKP